MPSSSALPDLLRALGRALGEWRIYALLLVLLAGWSLAYQHKTEYFVDVGGPHDDAYARDFHAKERVPERTYRWSGSFSTVSFPGIGNQPVEVTVSLVGYRPGGSPPIVEVSARGATQQVQTTGEPQDVTIFVPRGDALAGDLDVQIAAPPFSPLPDPRDLGVVVDRVTVRPARYGLQPVVIPWLTALAGMSMAVLCTYLLFYAALRRTSSALAGGAALGLLFGALIIAARPELGLLARGLPGLSGWTLAVGLLAMVMLASSSGSRGRWAQGVAALAVAGAFDLRYGGLTYPQLLSSDLLFHVHNAQRVAGGQWVFPGFLPNGTEVPYPPALYVLLAPFAAITGTGDESFAWLLKLSGSLLDSATCLGLAWAGSRLGLPRAGAAAALFYAVSPAPFELLSAGNYSNLFAQAFFNLAMLGSLVYAGAGNAQFGTGRGAWLLLPVALGLGLTMLGHYGMMLGALAVGGLYAVWALFQLLRGRMEARAWHVVGVYAAALAGSFALYYWRFLEQMWAQVSGVAGRLVAPAETPDSGSSSDIEGLAARLARRLGTLVGIGPLIAALAGLALAPRAPAARALLLAWLGAAALFLAVDQAVGDAVRWYYLAAAPVALLGGRFLARLGASRWGGVLAGLVLLAALWQLLGFWVGEAIFVRYH